MNWDVLTRNVGQRVQLLPAACDLDADGREVGRVDDDWILEGVIDQSLEISNARTLRRVKLGKDHIHHFHTNPQRGGESKKYGYLTLTVQVFIRGDKVTTHRSVSVQWEQESGNSIAGAKLIVCGMNGRLALPNQNAAYPWGFPAVTLRQKFEIDVTREMSVCWLDQSNPAGPLSSLDLANHCVHVYLDLLERAPPSGGRGPRRRPSSWRTA